MKAVYWDTSALLKLYAAEADSSAYTRQFVAQHEDIAVGFLHRVEMHYALRGKEARGEIVPGSAKTLFSSFARHLAEGRFFLVPGGDDVEENSRQVLDRCLAAMPPVMVRTLDGLHLGSIVAAGISSLITADVRMRQAASLAGIHVIEV